MQKVNLIIILLLLSFQSVSQTKAEQSLSHTINYDTLLTPDYYSAKITIAEYTIAEGEGRKRRYSLISLDTAVNDFMREIKQLGYNFEFRKSSISEKINKTYNEKSYFDGKMLFQVTYEFDIHNKDSIEKLFQNIKKERLQSFVVTQKFYSSTLENAKDKLINKGLIATKVYAQKIANENNQRIIKQTNTFLGFTQKYNPNAANVNSYGQIKDFVLQLEGIEYTLNIYYSYIFEDSK